MSLKSGSIRIHSLYYYRINLSPLRCGEFDTPHLDVFVCQSLPKDVLPKSFSLRSGVDVLNWVRPEKGIEFHYYFITESLFLLGMRINTPGISPLSITTSVDSLFTVEEGKKMR